MWGRRGLCGGWREARKADVNSRTGSGLSLIVSLLQEIKNNPFASLLSKQLILIKYLNTFNSYISVLNWKLD